MALWHWQCLWKNNYNDFKALWNAAMHTHRHKGVCLSDWRTADEHDTLPKSPVQKQVQHVAPAKSRHRPFNISSLPPSCLLPFSVICLKCKVNNVPDWQLARSWKKSKLKCDWFFHDNTIKLRGSRANAGKITEFFT